MIQSDWPEHAQLVAPLTGKDIQLNDQHVLVATVVRDAISPVTQEILLWNSFPETDSKLQYWCQVILKAAKAAKASFQPILDIHAHAKVDDNFCDALGWLVSVSIL